MKILAKRLATIISICVLLFGLSWVIYMPTSAERGVWRLSTGGNIIRLTPFTATLYTETSHSCYSQFGFPAHLKLVEMAEGAIVSEDSGKLSLFVDGSLETRTFERIDALPENCIEADPTRSTAQDVFAAVWTAMDEHYAFFDLHGVDWEERKSHIPHQNVTMTNDEIRQGLLAMMDGLDDGHVHFGTDTLGFASPAERPAWMPDDGSITRASLVEIAIASAGVALTKAENAPVFYGLRPDGIGYILVREMDVDVPFGGNSTDAIAKVMERVLSDLSEATALIFDVRYNPGGSDSVSFGIASHFVDQPTEVFTKTTLKDGAQAAPFTAILEPFDQIADGRPTLVLTSRLTGSAAEIFTMAMRELPNVATVGEPTSGGLSDVMGFVLPNGWGLGLSNQTYLTVDGKLFEAIGIPPDLTLPYDTRAYQSGEDPVLRQAFERLNR